jgi:hypothetical protein
MPSVSKEVLDLIREVALQAGRLDNLRNETQGLLDLRIKVALHDEKLAGRARGWNYIWMGVIAVIGGVAGALAREIMSGGVGSR